MWDVLSGDFDMDCTASTMSCKCTTASVPGSIIVFHDSEKAFPKLAYALPKMSELFLRKRIFI